MTRGKWVALAVGLAVIAVLIPYGPALWWAVAYVEERRIVLIAYEDPNGAEYLDEQARVLRKRWSWVLGPEHRVRCGRCQESDHRSCPRLLSMAATWRSTGKILGLDGVFSGHLCDCPHPSHAQASE